MIDLTFEEAWRQMDAPKGGPHCLVDAPPCAARSGKETPVIIGMCLAGLFTLSLASSPAAAQPYHCH
jgi:hypothetical protein